MARKGKTLAGHFVVALIFAFVFYINHRTSTVAFGIIWLFSYVRTPISRWLTFYYRYYLHFISGVLGFLLVYVMYTQVGIFKAFRGRMPMWMNHSRHYWEGSPAEILMGKLRVLLPASWDPHHELWSLDEVHQNTFSLLVFGGLFGYFLYCMFMRATYFFVHNRLRYGSLQYIASACFLFFTIFGLTNEHIYYPTIVWPIFVWLFLVVGISTSHVESVTSQAS
ncbi:MAG: hypothetical protein HC859_12865 [Bacteroidia bacterium]|nr:hypothetical protein [Bacteroidia bacterium]